MLAGRYIMHTGLQHLHILPHQPNALTLNSTLLPEVLRHYGHKNYLVGKWHLGFYAKEYLPHNRGFDKHFGIYPGQATHYDRTVYGKYCLVENGSPIKIKQRIPPTCMCRKPRSMLNSISQSTLTNLCSCLCPGRQFIFRIKYLNIMIKLYDKSKQSNERKVHAAMATGSNGWRHQKHYRFVHQTWPLEQHGHVLFNRQGGHTTYAASNHPLAGEKATLYEGGIRGVAFASGKGINPGRVSNSLMHITDIYPTIVALTQQNIKQREDPFKDYFKTLDGYDVWSTIAKDTQSPRHELLINIDPVTPVRGTFFISWSV